MTAQGGHNDSLRLYGHQRPHCACLKQQRGTMTTVSCRITGQSTMTNPLGNFHKLLNVSLDIILKPLKAFATVHGKLS